jgi:hypothetical protein
VTRRVVAAVVVICLVAACAVAVSALFSGASPRIESFGPSPRVLRATGTSFRPETPPSGIISKEQALKSGGGLRHALNATDVHYSLVFGRFSDFDLSVTNGSAWILTIRQVAVPISHGPSRLSRLGPVQMEGDIVIDAKTGRYVEGFGG